MSSAADAHGSSARRIRKWPAGAAAALALFAGPAGAHAIDPRIGDFYAGLLHPLTAFEHVLPIVALGLLTAQHGLRRSQLVLLLFPLAFAAGAWFSLEVPSLPAIFPINIFWAVLLGVLVATAVSLPLPLLYAIAVGCALTHGYANGQAMTPESKAALFVLGLAVAAFLALAYVVVCADFALRQKARWLPVAIRVGGSWIAAIGILVLSLAHRAAVP